ncbi:MAG TPA: tetratricopeptide repeat protein [bacterium]|nr:tetratricopeptide repeat protein [bacterium]
MAIDTEDILSVPVPLFLFKGGPNDRYRLAMGPLERKVLIALAVSGEPETMENLAAATDLEPAQLESVLTALASKGIVTLLREPAAAPEPDLGPPPGPVPMPEGIIDFPHDIIEDGAPEPPPPPEPGRFELPRLLAYLESLREKNFYRMLGLTPDAARSRIRRVYFELVSDYHPDRHREVKDQRVLEVLAEIFETLTTAYETLHNKKRRRLYDRTIPEFTGAAESEEDEALSRLFGDRPPEKTKGKAKKESQKPLGWSFYQTAVEAFKSGDYQTADLNFKLAVGMDPDRPEYKEGLERAKQIINQNVLDGLKRDAETLEKQKKFPEAVMALVKASEIDPADPAIRYNLARIRFLKTMDRVRAEEDISWAISLDPNSVDALLLLGRIQVWKGNNDAAIATFKQVLRIVPGHPKAKQALALVEK